MVFINNFGKEKRVISSLLATYYTFTYNTKNSY